MSQARRKSSLGQGKGSGARAGGWKIAPGHGAFRTGAQASHLNAKMRSG